MKKLLIIASAALLLAACSSDPMKEILSETVKQNVGYKFLSYKVIDTVTYADASDSIRESYRISDKVSLDEFKNQRNREFVEFRSNMPDYEEQVMRGELKDASPWCTEIREVTELADSLIAVWENVNPEDYEYNYFEAWYVARGAHYFGLADAERLEVFRDVVKANKKDFLLLLRLSTSDQNNVYCYKVMHEYSIDNPIFENGERIIMRDIVSIDSDLNVVDVNSAGSANYKK